MRGDGDKLGDQEAGQALEQYEVRRTLTFLELVQDFLCLVARQVPKHPGIPFGDHGRHDPGERIARPGRGLRVEMWFSYPPRAAWPF